MYDGGRGLSWREEVCGGGVLCHLRGGWWVWVVVQ